ncbi:MAG: tail fiber domain-containing protein [Phycisphaeraceae bacterium]|nr:tail fiber domain-containing protein [Phycisphaeraceae bacterium]
MRGFVGSVLGLFLIIGMAAAGPNGAVEIPPSEQSPFDDRSAPNAYQYDTLPATLLWRWGDETLAMDLFDAAGGRDLITSISVMWYVVADGTSARVFVWQDPNGQGNPREAVLVHEQAVQVQGSGTATYTTYTLTKGVPVQGRFYVGVSVPTTGYTLAAENNPSAPAGRCFLGGTTTPPINAANLGAIPLLYDITLTNPGHWKLRASGSGSVFSYQGRLTQSGANYTGPADFKATVYDSASGGIPVSPVVSQTGVGVVGGVFGLEILANPSWFQNAPDRYLEIAVRTPEAGGVYSTLSPRQRIGQVPAAMVATTAQNVPWSGITGAPAGASAWSSSAGGIAYTGGRVGIGTSSPGAILTVSGLNSYNHMEVASTFEQGTWFNLTNSSAGGRTWALCSTGSINEEGAGAVLLRDNTAAAVRMAVLPNGNVGIGTITPQAKLDVQGSIAASGPVLFGNNLNDLLVLNGSPGGPNFGIGVAPSTLRIHTAVNLQNISFGYGYADAFTQTALIAGNGNLTITGNAFKPGGGSWAISSDPRLKHDISPLTGTLDRLLSLRGYQFFYNDDVIRSNRGMPGVQIGLMGDEVERVFPDWVTRDENGMRMVTERSTTALMVEALRDLRAEKDEQIRARDTKIESQGREIEDLNARLQRVEEILKNR